MNQKYKKTEISPIIKEQIELIEEIFNIIQKQISDIEAMGKGIVLPDEIEDLKRTKVLQTKYSYLKTFNEIVQFLLGELKKEESGRFKFYLPNIRTLLEVYARLIYLCSKDENQQMAMCAANLLFTLAHTIQEPGRDAAERVKVSYEGVRESYKENYLYFKPFLDRENIDIPRDIKDFSGNRLKNLGLDFPPVDKMLNKELIEHYCPETTRAYPKIAETIYSTYRFTSNYIHGNVLTLGTHGKEKLWIIAKTQILSNLIVDLVNTKVTNNSRKTELIKWMREVNVKKPRFVEFWLKDNINS